MSQVETGKSGIGTSPLAAQIGRMLEGAPPRGMRGSYSAVGWALIADAVLDAFEDLHPLCAVRPLDRRAVVRFNATTGTAARRNCVALREHIRGHLP